jgi:Fur family iron response transcriptional regulator
MRPLQQGIAHRHVVGLPEDAHHKTEMSPVTRDRLYVVNLLKSVGLRPTRQRVALGCLLFGAEHRHLTAEMFFEVAISAKIRVSLATVYNTLNQFTELGLLRRIGIDGTKTYFDTNVSEHGHFYLEQSHELVDIADLLVAATRMSDFPSGYEVSRIDVVVRLRRKPT